MSSRLTISLSQPLADYLGSESAKYNVSRQRIVYDCIIDQVKHKQRHQPKMVYSSNYQYISTRRLLEKIGEQLDTLNKNLEDKAKATNTLLNYGISDIKSKPEHLKTTGDFFSSDMHKIFLKLNSISKLHQKLNRTVDNMIGYSSSYYDKKAAKTSNRHSNS